ncbi:uncharacterized protein LOC124160748 isoform X2 [Ischnura elegans]|uniref:uncharacterized protein LOC124160748 isoform X2 n=1 Tax=Ischnura elegans TaxID=197161 RepID=UPI001ED89F5C|nr:uncharacterized protein LOC124160748 isoform X2 [Ischnura elegans]
MDRSEGVYPNESGEKATKRTTPYSRGQATSFGFKRRTPTAVKSPQAKSESRSGASSGRASPLLAEALPQPSPVSPVNNNPASGGRPINRFGFRGPAGNVSLVRGDKVGDTNSNEALPFAPPTPIVFAQKEARNNAVVDRNILTESNASSRAGSNKNTPTQARLAERLTFQSKQLPRPQVPQLMGKASPIPASAALVGGGAVSKGAKTAANRKMAQHRADSSESLGADSGLGMLDSIRAAGPHSGSGSSGATYSGVEAAETDTLLGVEPLATAELWAGPGLTLVSPPPPLPPLPTNPSARTLEVVLNQAGGTFELRDRGRKVGVTEEKKPRPTSGLPRPVSSIPGAPTGNVVRQRTLAYRPQAVEKDKSSNSPSPVPHASPANKVTTTASEPERDEGSGENEEKAWRDRSSTEKSAQRGSVASTSEEEGCTGSGSEDQEWGHGEAMADELSDEGCVSFAGGIISSSGDEAGSIMPQVPRVVHLTISPGVSQPSLHPLKTVLEKSNERIFSSSGSSASSSGGRPSSGAGVRPRPGGFPNEVNVRRQNSQLSVSTTPASSESQDSPSPTGSLSLSDGSSPGALGGGFGRSCSSGADDFLIDDEIADQPGLTFCAGDVAAELTESFSLLQAEETSATLVEGEQSKLSSASGGGVKPDDDDPTILDMGLVSEGNLEDDDLITQSKTNGTPRHRASSIGTLSPCDSITSDDLMLDFERSECSVATNSAAAPASSAASWDENAVTERLACSSLPHLLDDLCTTSERGRHSSSGSSNSSRLMKEWTNLIGAHSKDNSSGGLSDGGDGRTGSRQTRLLRPRASSTASEASPLSTQTTPNASPGGRIPLRTGSATSLRPPRQSNCDNEYVQIERGTYLDMFQDIVSIKTMLFKLKRVLQEAETLNPFDSSLKNGLFYHLANSDLPSTIIPNNLSEGNGVSSEGEENQPNGRLEAPPSQPQEEVADMKRQVVFLQQQLEEVNRSKVLLQRQLSKCACGNGTVNCSGNTSPKKEASCNVATQTERIRPVSMGPILQNCPTDGSGGGPLVSNLSEMKRKSCESSLPSPRGGMSVNRRLPVSTAVSKRPGTVRHWK